MAEHLKLTVHSMDLTKKGQEELKVKVEKVEKDNEDLVKQLAEHKETLSAATQNLRSYQARLSKAEKTVAEHKNTIVQIRERTEVSSSQLCFVDPKMYRPHSRTIHRPMEQVENTLKASRYGSR